MTKPKGDSRLGVDKQ